MGAIERCLASGGTYASEGRSQTAARFSRTAHARSILAAARERPTLFRDLYDYATWFPPHLALRLRRGARTPAPPHGRPALGGGSPRARSPAPPQRRPGPARARVRPA